MREAQSLTTTDRDRGPIESLGATLAGFRDASPALLEQRALLRRSDSKFMAPATLVGSIIGGLAGDYAAVRVAGGSVATYLNLYFDTPDLICFHDHRRGRRVRHKIRIRNYPERGLSFLEVKTRLNDIYTEKQRLSVPFGSEALGDREDEFLRTRCPFAGELRPTLRVDFRRISLIGLATDERVSIDLHIAMSSEGIGQAFDDLALIEVKQAAPSTRTPIVRALHGVGLRACSVSKYATAIALTRTVPSNNLKPVLRGIDRMGR